MAEQNNNTDNKSRGLLIFFMALLTIYIVLTLAVAVIFEYYTVRTSDGEIIFSLTMSWQLIVFVLELATIIVQLVMLIRTLKSPSQKNCAITFYAGLSAAVISAIAAIILLATQGIGTSVTIVFLIYTLLIVCVRALAIPRLVKKISY